MQRGWWLVLAGVVVFALGAAPLTYYGLFVDPAGNPVGLGMLFALGVLVSLPLAGLGFWRLARDRGARVHPL
jgi:uncharacterized membrane protein